MFAPVSAASMGDNTVLPAKPGVRYVVENSNLVAAGAVAATWKSGASTALSGAMTMATGVPHPLPSTNDYHGGLPQGWFQTAYGEALVLGLGAAVQVSGHIAYREEREPQYGV